MPNHLLNSEPKNTQLPRRLRWGEPIYLHLRAQWRAFLPVHDDFVEESPDLMEGSAEWRHLLPDQRDLISLNAYPNVEYDDGTPVYHLPRRLLAVILLLTLLALVAYELYGLFTPPIKLPELPAPPAISV